MVELKYALMVLAYFFNPEIRKKRDLQKDIRRLKELEQAYRRALAEGNPQQAGQLDKEMREIRLEYKFLNEKA